MNHYEEEAEETMFGSFSRVLSDAIEGGYLEPQVGAEMSRTLEADTIALAALRRIVSRALTSGQLEKLEDAKPYL